MRYNNIKAVIVPEVVLALKICSKCLFKNSVYLRKTIKTQISHSPVYQSLSSDAVYFGRYR